MAAGDNVFHRTVDASCGTAFQRNGETVCNILLQSHHDDIDSTHDSSDLRGEQTQRSGAENNDILAGQKTRLLCKRLVGVADGIENRRFLVADVFGDFPERLRMDAQDLAGDLAVFGKAAAVAIAETEVQMLRAEQEITAHTGGALPADMAGVVGDDTLADLPVLYVLANLDDLAGELMAADGTKFVRTIVYVEVLHVCPADCGSLNLNDHILITADGLWNINKVICSELRGFSVFCQRFHLNNLR